MSQPLRLAIVHYHLKRGGVTRVIESTLRGFHESGQSIEVVVLAGEVPDDFSAKEHAVAVPGLRYSNAQSNPPDSATLLLKMKAAAKSALGSEPDLWHIHNHSLGKNAAMAGVITALADQGAALLLQMHDFAEDGRPENFRLIESAPVGHDQIYPTHPRIHYAVLNQRDYQHFKQTGIAEEQLLCLPNPVEAPESPADPARSQALLQQLNIEELILYPVRAVRRKNFGEMLLWAACMQPGTHLANTLGPTNQNYQADYDTWRSFAAELNLPVHFSIAEGNDWTFPEIMGAANSILSTSIAEGFGLAFLEPWLFGKSIVGRDLPEITADFKTAGLELDHLYNALWIPQYWLDMDTLRSALSDALQGSYQSYDIDLPEDAVDRALSSIQQGDRIDFGGLNEALQRSVIQYICTNSEARDELKAQIHLTNGSHDSTISTNAAIISQKFGLNAYAESLTHRYQTILKQPQKNTTYLNAQALLGSFLQPESFRLLRT